MDQKLVAVRKDGGSFVMKGDEAEGSADNASQSALPRLLASGWRLGSIHMTASAAVNDDQVLGLVVLEKR